MNELERRRKRFGIGEFVGDEYTSSLIVDRETGKYYHETDYDQANNLVKFLNAFRGHSSDYEATVAFHTRYWDDDIDHFGESSEWRRAYNEGMAP